MNKDWGNYLAKDQTKYKRGEGAKWKINNLLTELLEKDEEISLYKKRLKELETAFYYNLELISERDLELSVLEKQLGCDNDQLHDIIRERNELEELVKVIDNKNNKKIRQLETKLALKGEEIRDIQRENTAKLDTLKRLLDDVKHQQEKKVSKINSKFELEKKEIIQNYQEEMEEKERYYLLEIDNLAGKLAQACIEKEELLKSEKEHKTHVEHLKRLFLEKENKYLEEIRKKNNTRKINKEIQCEIKPQVFEKRIQVEQDKTTVFCQTIHHQDDDYIEKINFLQEQNEVLKHIVKDLKRNRNFGDGNQPPGCECFQIRTEIDKVNQKFQCEINNLKKILEEEHKFREEEDVVIQSLETSVTFLKDKLLLSLQEKPQEGDESNYTEAQVNLLERKLSQKIDTFVTAAQEENQKLYKKLEELKKECVEKMEKYLKPDAEFRSENLLQRIRLEIQKLEDKIESDMKNLVRNNFDKNKCDKNIQRKVDFPESRNEWDGSVGLCYRNDLSPEKYISIFKCPQQGNNPNQIRKRIGEQKLFRRVTNNLVLGR